MFVTRVTRVCFNESIVRAIDLTCRHVVCSFEHDVVIKSINVVLTSPRPIQRSSLTMLTQPSLAIRDRYKHFDSVIRRSHNEVPTHERLLVQRSEIATTDSMSLDAVVIVNRVNKRSSCYQHRNDL